MPATIDLIRVQYLIQCLWQFVNGKPERRMVNASGSDRGGRHCIVIMEAAKAIATTFPNFTSTISHFVHSQQALRRAILFVKS